ncbi:DUF371 domain-containing protein [Methanospirillum lacunae]|uniref:DUF371 domain-containing protein n=1 Tax=Methanospirillum lacunae TaxID=668570 RepID=A0A2V2N0C6_9EURY|nr:DUF371 domain-containing protein [Methanospirillum lacunae]PWR72015.1 DUF371 domain-containing protein [Methanospirillum lacunae]
MPRAVEQFSAFGHPEVTATHRTTFEITAEQHLSSSGNCIIAVRSEKGAVDLSDQFRELIRSPGCRLITELRCRDVEVTVTSSGSPNLLLDHQTDMVWRRSSFTCGRTIGLYSDYTAGMLPRELITLLKLGERLDITLIAELDPYPNENPEPCILPGLNLLIKE